jgi:hypothetical protein
MRTIDFAASVLVEAVEDLFRVACRALEAERKEHLWQRARRR